jgi:hypothetical protein
MSRRNFFRQGPREKQKKNENENELRVGFIAGLLSCNFQRRMLRCARGGEENCSSTRLK